MWPFHVGDHPVRSGDITERQRIPKRYLEQVLQTSWCAPES